MLQDIGVCFGQDTRQLLLDGWSAHELIAVDVVPDYWYLVSPLANLMVILAYSPWHDF